MSEDIMKKIQTQIDKNKIIVYMKGTKEIPQCGFSARVVQILNSYGVSYETVDILVDPELRQALKEFSNWPTFPQLYVNGRLIGGCDICVEMARSGELEPLVKSAAEG
jgi:monothiol glutaredoxin